MPLYSTNNSDVLLKTSLESNIGLVTETKATNADTTSKGLVGIVKGLWQTLLDRLPALSNGAIPVTISGTGVASSITRTELSVTTSSQTALATNANRIGWIITNPDTNTNNVYIEFAGTTTITTGLIIPPGYERTPDFPYNGVISIIGEATTTIDIREFVK